MPGLPSQEVQLFLLQVVALLGALGRIRLSNLDRVYPYFYSYLVIQTLQLAVPLAGRGTNRYAYLYFSTEALIICFYALVVLELYTLVLRDLTGIATTARRYIRWSLFVAICVALLLVEVQRTPPTPLGVFFTFERTIVSSLLVFLFLITGFLVYYPVPLNRNVIYYSIGYAVYFACRVAALFLVNTDDRLLQTANIAAFYGSVSCLAFWIVCLRRSGEKKTVILGHHWNIEDREKVMAQLKAINATLLRVRE